MKLFPGAHSTVLCTAWENTARREFLQRRIKWRNPYWVLCSRRFHRYHGGGGAFLRGKKLGIRGLIDAYGKTAQLVLEKSGKKAYREINFG